MKTLLLVIPSVVSCDHPITFDGDFGNNLESYLAYFDKVTIACPISRMNRFPTTRKLHDISGHERAKLVSLPEPYREDRYISNRSFVSKVLSAEIDSSSHLLISPHAPFCWSTLAAEICIKKKRAYNMEADANLPQISRYIWSQMPFGFNKLRKFIWLKYHSPKYWRCLRESALSLVQGEDVFEAYRHIAPNAHQVLNVQITQDQRITKCNLNAKVHSASLDRPLKIVYAGRAVEIKGPMYWLRTLQILQQKSFDFEATWLGDGSMMPAMQRFVVENSLGERVKLPGSANRDDVFTAVAQSDVFLFCHMSKESPRCLVEALALGTPLIGFGSSYSRGLTQKHGGGVFVNLGDVEGLASVVEGIKGKALSQLISQAAKSGQDLDREKAIRHRIELMMKYLKDQR